MPMTSKPSPSISTPVFSSSPMPRCSGSSATALSSRGTRPRSPKCMSMSAFGTSPRPGPVRTAAADTSEPAPPRIIVRPIAVAPALVPATTRPSGQPVTDDVVGARADQGAQLGLVTAGEEHAGGVRQQVGRVIAVSVAAAAQPQLAGVIDAKLAEHPLVVGEYFLRHVGSCRDQHDPGLVAAAELNEPLKQARAAATILGAADDEQPTWRSPVVHVLRPCPGPSAVQRRRSYPRLIRHQSQGQIHDGTWSGPARISLSRRQCDGRPQCRPAADGQPADGSVPIKQPVAVFATYSTEINAIRTCVRRCGAARPEPTGLWLLGARRLLAASAARARPRPGQLIWQLQQRVGGAGDDVACDVDHPAAAAAGSLPAAARRPAGA